MGSAQGNEYMVTQPISAAPKKPDLSQVANFNFGKQEAMYAKNYGDMEQGGFPAPKAKKEYLAVPSNLPTVNPLTNIKSIQRAGSSVPFLSNTTRDTRGEPRSIRDGVFTKQPGFMQNSRIFDAYVQNKTDVKPLKGGQREIEYI